jgi:sugar phosphate isomerase/epimerase
MKLGFSTSSFYRIPEIDTKRAVAVFRELGCEVIELSASELERIEWLDEVRREDIEDFSFVSVHAPDQLAMEKLSLSEQKKVLDALEHLHKKLNFQAVVFHPDPWLGDFSILKQYDFPVSIENMDQRHSAGTTVENMRHILDKGDFRIALDLNHCYTHDETMKLAHDFYEAFQGNISHFHLSDFHNFQEGQRHQSFFRMKHNRIFENIPDKNLPVLLEESLSSVEEGKQEIEYLKNFLEF